MALPIESVTLNNLATSTIDSWLDDLIDDFFLSNPLVARLLSRNNVIIDGGYQIRQNLIYAGVGGGSHATGTPYDTSLKQWMTAMIFQWKELYAPLAMDELDQAKNQGAAAVVDYAMALKDVAELSLFDTFGTQIYQSSPGTNDLDSLITGIPAYNSAAVYGGITANTSAQGLAIAPNSGNVNTVGGLFSWDMLQTSYGAATYGSEQPDLIVTTQTIYNKMIARAIPGQRWRNEDLKKIFGADGLGYNKADIMVDQHCPSGYIFLLNTKYWRMVLCRGRNFVRRSSLYGLPNFPIFNDSQWVDQIVVFCDLIDKAPRLSSYISSVS